MQDFRSVLPALVLLCVVFFSYWFPALLANKRRHRDKGSIFFVNLFFGWTVLGWVIALIWSASGTLRAKLSSVNA